MKRLAITGMGAVTAIGVGTELLAPKSLVDSKVSHSSGMCCLKDFQPKNICHLKECNF